MPVTEAAASHALGLAKIVKDGNTRHVEVASLEQAIEEGWTLVHVNEAPPAAPDHQDSTLERVRTNARRDAARSGTRRADTGMVRREVRPGHFLWVDPTTEDLARERFERQADEAYSELQREERAREKLNAANQNLALLAEQDAEQNAEAREREQVADTAYAEAQQGFIDAVHAAAAAGAAYRAAHQARARTPKSGITRTQRLALRFGGPLHNSDGTLTDRGAWIELRTLLSAEGL